MTKAHAVVWQQKPLLEEMGAAVLPGRFKSRHDWKRASLPHEQHSAVVGIQAGGLKMNLILMAPLLLRMLREGAQGASGTITISLHDLTEEREL